MQPAQGLIRPRQSIKSVGMQGNTHSHSHFISLITVLIVFILSLALEPSDLNLFWGEA